jgi:hypothetical protein
VQALQLYGREGVEIHARQRLGGARALQPTEQHLGSTQIGDSALAQPAFDLGVCRRPTTTRGAACKQWATTST